DELIMGVEISRPDNLQEDLIGQFGNLVVLRSDFSAEGTFEQTLKTVRQRLGRAMEHTIVPFAKIVEDLRPARDPNYHTLCQVVFSFEFPRSAPCTSPKLCVRRMDLQPCRTRYDLAFRVTENSGAIGVAIEYATDLFEATSIRRMLGHLGTLLEGMV